MSRGFQLGPFAATRRDVDEFCHNLILSYAMNQCIEQLMILEKQYEEALLRDDIEEIEQKKLELQVYQSSLNLTAYVLERETSPSL